MAKKAKAKSKKQYSNGWATRRKNAAKLGTSPHKFASKAIVKTRRKPVVADALAPAAQAQAVQAVRKDWDAVGKQRTLGVEQPRTLDDTINAIRARTLVIIGRKKGGAKEIENELARIESLAEYNGRKKAEDQASEQRVEIVKANDIKIVAAFMAEIGGIGKLNGGPLPSCIMVSGLTIAKVYDALARAGYTSEGKGGLRQDCDDGVMGKSHAEVFANRR